MVNCFFDPGSTCSLVLSEFAEKYKLEGRNVTVIIDTVNGEKVRETKLYVIELMDSKGDRRLVRAFGVEKISGEIPAISFEGIKHKFSQDTQEVWEKATRRPKGSVNLLIGAEVASYFPSKLEAVGNLVVLESEFGSGYSIFGTDPDLEASGIALTEEVQLIRQLGQSGMKVTVQETSRISVNLVNDFMAAEELGVEAPRRCKRCAGCPVCSFSGQQHTEKEALEYQMIEKGVKYVADKEMFEVNYPFIDDPGKLSDNFFQAIRIAEREEHKLRKEGLTEEFNDKFQEMLNLGTIAEVSQLEMDNWCGPKHYVSVQHVLKPDSVTTRLRLVINSSLVDPVIKLSLNDMMAKGPNILADMWKLLLRFRSYSVGLVADVSKAYHSLKTGLLEKHLRRIVWRFADSKKDWKVYAFLVVTFGDRPAGTILQIAIRIVCHAHFKIDPYAANKLLNDLFVDDLSSGGEQEEVTRFKGSKDENGRFTGSMSQIMNKGNLRFKAMAQSFEEDGEDIYKLGGAVLGVPWRSQDDKFIMKISINVSKRKRGIPTEPDIDESTFYKLDKIRLTKRICLGIVNSVFDPIGLISPLVINLKVMMKKNYSKEYELQWDSDIPDELLREWIKVLKVLVGTVVEFDRSYKPYGAFGEPDFAAFWDGSDIAFAAVIYAVWRAEEEEEAVDVRLVTSKTRVSPDWDLNTVRTEINGVVLCTRLVVNIVRAVEMKPKVVWISGDSETVLASRKKHAGFFSEYFGNRIGETFENQRKIEEICPVGFKGEWYHLPGAENPADRPSRIGSTPEDVAYGSEWQKGKGFLRLPRKDWPLERNFAEGRKEKVSITKKEVNKKYRCLVDDEVPAASVSLVQLERAVENFEKSKDGGKEVIFKTIILSEVGPEHP